MARERSQGGVAPVADTPGVETVQPTVSRTPQFEMLPNFSKMGYTAKQKWLHKDQPCISPILYSIKFKDDRVQFGKSNSQGNFNYPEFEEEKRRAFPQMAWIQYYETEEQFNVARSKK